MEIVFTTVCLFYLIMLAVVRQTKKQNVSAIRNAIYLWIVEAVNNNDLEHLQETLYEVTLGRNENTENYLLYC